MQDALFRTPGFQEGRMVWVIRGSGGGWTLHVQGGEKLSLTRALSRWSRSYARTDDRYQYISLNSPSVRRVSAQSKVYFDYSRKGELVMGWNFSLVCRAGISSSRTYVSALPWYNLLVRLGNQEERAGGRKMHHFSFYELVNENFTLHFYRVCFALLPGTPMTCSDRLCLLPSWNLPR